MRDRPAVATATVDVLASDPATIAERRLAGHRRPGSVERRRADRCDRPASDRQRSLHGELLERRRRRDRLRRVNAACVRPPGRDPPWRAARARVRQRDLAADPDGRGEHVQEQADRRGGGRTACRSRRQVSAQRGEHVAGGEAAVVERRRAAVGPPSIAAAATSIAACSSRMLRGGGKYSSSSVTRTSSTPWRGASRAITASTSSSGRRRAGGDADRPGEVVGQLVGVVDPEHTRACPPRSRASRAPGCSTSWPSR